MSDLIKRVLLSTIFVAVTVGSGASFAATSDGGTPSSESVCDVYQGAKNGAFGLCNAYCEAMDCGDPLQHSANMACTKINDKFEKRFGFRLPEGYSLDANGNFVNNCVIGDGDDEQRD